MQANVQEVRFPIRGDDRGKLIALESLSEQAPFEVKRVYYIFDTTPGTIRGKHAHRQLKQVLVCLAGACTIDCEMPDGTKTSHRLGWPDRGLLIEGLVWREMRDLGGNAILWRYSHGFND